jgi:pimeloyl-ACP methyl ester carboxylesterase
MKCGTKLLVWAVLPVVLMLFAGAGFLIRPVTCFNEMTYLKEFLGGVENHSVEVAGRRMHYEVQGPVSGPAVVLVHGLGGRAEDWLPLARFLVKAGFRVYTPDLVGYGRSEKPADFSYAVHDEAEQVVAFLDVLGLRQVDLGGWSMGGGIAQHVAGKHPERVRRLILFDSVGIWEKPDWNVHLFTPTSPGELDQLDALLMPNPPQVPGFIARDILRISRERAWVIHRATDSMLTGQDATDNLLPQLKMPVLIVWGEKDRIIPLSIGEKMQSLVPHARLAVFSGCGHLAPGQCADRIAPTVVDFLKQ